MSPKFESLPELASEFAAGALVEIVPRDGKRGYQDHVEDGFIRLWSDAVGRHVQVHVGARALVVGQLPVVDTGDLAVVEVLVESPGLGPVVVSTFADRLRSLKVLE